MKDTVKTFFKRSSNGRVARPNTIGVNSEEINLREENIFDFPFFDFLKNNQKIVANVLLAVFVIVFLLFIFFWMAPSEFPSGSIISIDEGFSLNEITDFLEGEALIKSSFWFKTFVYLSGNQKSVVSGDYFFKRPIGLFGLVSRLIRGQYGINPTDITIPEGTSVAEISEIFQAEFKDFDGETFVKLAKGREGFLFPDTYKFLPNVGPREVIGVMEDNFAVKIAELQEEINRSGRSLEEIIIMASLLEEEARTQETREIISGILWKRLGLGMLLQVDAVFGYIIGKNTYQLTLEDLEFDSPYNTYLYPGLPAGSITNPGLSSIKAALRPRELEYLFYLSDRNGNMYYASNFEDHKKNKRLYLN